MSKRYFLVPSNSEPTPGKGKTLHGVDNHSVEELIKVNDKYGMFIKKCNYQNYTTTVHNGIKERTFATKIKTWVKIKKAAFFHIPKQIRKAFLFLSFYFSLLTLIIIFCNNEFAVRVAFVAFISSFLLGPCKFFIRDKIYGALIVFLLSAGVGFFLGEFYFFVANRYIAPVKILNRDNIGNLLTILSLLISFAGYFNDLLFVYEVDVHIEDIKNH